MEPDYYNILESELDQSVYRIINYDRLIEILKTGDNSFVRTFMWEDPFENLFTNKIFENKRQFSISYLSFHTYAQCWSFSKENDLLWRTYSPSRDSVRIKSTPRKLIATLRSSSKIKNIISNPKILHEEVGNDLKESISIFLGKVQYLEKEEIYNFFKTNYENVNFDLYFKSLFIKREPFFNEEEFRIGVYHFNELDDTILKLSDNIFYYDIDANEMIDEVVFDPRISDEKVQGLKAVLEKKFKFENPIYKSKIYEKPNVEDFLK